MFLILSKKEVLICSKSDTIHRCAGMLSERFETSRSVCQGVVRNGLGFYDQVPVRGS